MINLVPKRIIGSGSFGNNLNYNFV